ncbi:MAG TPA: SDR family NAD(P)-dependent oxidoreductase [Candidatus Paceibacterota bacterium]
MFDLTGKVAVVTGARRGMGRSHAFALAKQGATVVITDIDLDECRAVQQEVNESCDSESACFRLDVSQKHEVDEVFDAVVAQYGRIDILVNNAGVYTPAPASELFEEEWDRTLDINLKGQFLCAQRAAKEMMVNRWGRIINIASVASGQVGIGLAGGAHYAASKGGVIALTESLAVEWAPYGINVNAIAPGAIDTDMSRARRMSKEKMDAFLKASVPLGRIGQPEEVSPMVVFLASEEASYVTGATFHVDGGWLAN